MKDASQFPITLGFGATTTPYSQISPHLGRDYGCPAGTSIIVSGTEIGLSGATGYVFGAHLHVAKYKDGNLGGGIYDASQKRTYYEPNGWNTCTGQVIFSQLNGTAGNEIIIQANDGYNYRYLHQSELISKVGDKIGASDVSYVGEYEFHIKYEAYFGPMSVNPPTDGDRNRWVLKADGSNKATCESNTVDRAMQSDARHPAWLAYIESLKTAAVPAIQLTKGNYRV